jgi:hypothetical protein
MMIYSGSPGHSLLMYCALLSLPQTYELAQPDAGLGMDSVLSIVSLMLKELAERADALQSAAAAKTGTDISQREQLATTKDEVTMLTQRADELSSAVCELLLDLRKTLHVEVGLRLHCLTGDSMCTDSVPR